jgi:transcriptional antiterminator RfaH
VKSLTREQFEADHGSGAWDAKGRAMTDLARALAPLVTVEHEAPIAAGHWYTVQANPNCESRARVGIDELKLPGAEVYLPIEHHWRKTSGTSKTRMRVGYPLFRGYLFLRFDLERVGTHAIRHTHGVKGFVTKTGGEPARVPAALIEELARAEAAAAFDSTVEGAAFAPGASVRIDDGPFAGLVGEVMRADSKDRVDLLLKFLHRSVPITVPIGSVSRA